MSSTPNSTARRRTARAFSRSAGQPTIPGPQRRIAPNPSRRTSRSPPTRNVSGAELSGYRRVDLDAALDGGEVDPLLDGVRSLARRAEDDGGDPSRGEERRVRPEGNADDVGRAGVAGHERGDLGVLRRLERLARDDDAALAVEPAEELGELCLDELDSLAWDRPPLAPEEAARGIAGVLLTARDEGRVERAAPEERVRRVGPQAAVEVLEPDEHV